MVQVKVEGAKNSLRDARTSPVQGLPEISARARRVEEPRVVEPRQPVSVFAERAGHGDGPDGPAGAVERWWGS